jgi:hypothetical protein
MGNPFAELGLSSEDGTMTIDHAIALSMTKSIEAALLQTLTTLTKSSKDMNRVFKVLGYAAASYLVLSGVAKVIEAAKKDGSSRKSDGGGK